MNQYGCYQNARRGNTAGGTGQTYGATGCTPSQGYRQGLRGSQSNGHIQQRGNCGARAPPVFSSPSSGNFYATPNGRQQQQSTSWGGSSARPRQGIGRANQFRSQSVTNIQPPCQQQQMPRQQQQSVRNLNQQQQPNPLGPPQFCAPQAIKVNVTAEQLQNAKNAPIYQDRAEPSQADNGNVKYIQLNWQDLLGGMENLRVTMAPPTNDPNNPNRQLRVSFGGQKTDPPQAGETPLKVISIQPAAATERMEIQKGNAFAGTMKVCPTPQTPKFRLAPTNYKQHLQAQSSQYSPAYRRNCRR